MAQNNDQLAVVQELVRRRDTLAPDQQAVVDELAKRFSIAPKTPASLSEKLGVSGAASIPLDFVEGIGAGVMSTVRGAAKLGQKLGGNNPLPPSVERTLDSAAQAPPSIAGQVGKGAEQLAEFLLPTGVVNKAAKVADAAIVGTRFARPIVSKAVRAGLEGLSAAGVTAVQTGSPEEAAKAGAAGAAVSGAISAAAPVVSKGLAVASRRVNPVMQAALDWAEKHGVPLTTGQRAGNRMVTKAERGLEYTPGSAGRAQTFFQNQEEKIEQAGRDLINRTQPGRNLVDYEAGQQLAQRVKNVIDDAKTNADNIYSDIRRDFSRHTQAVQVGVDKEGKPIIENLALPVDVTRAKVQLTPIYEELSRTMPELKRQSSPGYRALHELLNGPDVMDAATADRNLSALKALARGGNNPYLNTRSQGLAKKAISEIETEFNTALNAADSRIMPKLQQARALVKKQHQVAEMLDSLPDEPAALYKRITTSGDRTYDDLRFINTVAPAEMRQIGRTYLEGLLNTATETGNLTRADGIFRAWQNLGPKTKLLLFGNQQNVNELNKFFLSTKYLAQDANPSATTKMALATFGLLGVGVDALRTPGGPMEKAKTAGRDIVAMPVLANIAARVLLSPKGAKYLTGAMSLPPGTPGFRAAVNGLTSLLTRDEIETLKQQAPAPAPTPAAATPPPANPAVTPGQKTYTVTDPRGVVHTFTSPGSAEAFKKAAGLR